MSRVAAKVEKSPGDEKVAGTVAPYLPRLVNMSVTAVRFKERRSDTGRVKQRQRQRRLVATS